MHDLENARHPLDAGGGAAAFRMAVPLSCREWLPAVKPSLAVRLVSAVTIFKAAIGTSSCSAATWQSAVLIPCPSSALPVSTVTLPSAAMRIQESRYGLSLRLPGNGGFAGDACPFGAASWAGRRRVEKLTIKAPVPASTRRREMAAAAPFISRS